MALTLLATNTSSQNMESATLQGHIAIAQLNEPGTGHGGVRVSAAGFMSNIMSNTATRKIQVTLLAALLLSTGAAEADECHREIDAEKPQYTVGYGSLMESSSKRA